MAEKISEIYTELTVNDSKHKQGIKSAKRDLKGLEIDSKRVALMVAGVFAAAGVASVRFIRMAAEAREALSKFRVVFGEQSDATLKWADDFAEATGRSKFALRGFLASVQDLFVPMGFARDEAAELSKQVVELATDLSSFQNIPVDDVVRDLQSALVGNTETVRKYGVMLDAANTKQKAFEMTGKRSEKTLTNSEKVMARLALITGSTADAQGDAVRTAGSLANQMVRLESDLEQVGTQIGEALVPSALKFLEIIQKIMPDIRAFFSDVGGGTKFIKEFADGLMAATELVGQLDETIGKALGGNLGIFESIGKSQQMLGNALSGMFETGAAAPAIRAAPGRQGAVGAAQTRQMELEVLKSIDKGVREQTAIGD